MKAVDLKCEYLTNPLGLDERAPRLSWRLESPSHGARQTAYRLVAASTMDRFAAPDLWDTGVVKTDRCLDLVYAGKPLTSRQPVCWRVQVWDERGKASAWSDAACFEMGLLQPSDWTAAWIGRPLESREGSQPCPYLRRAFNLSGKPARARLYVTARGVFEAYLNGRRIGNDAFAPGWTEYKKRIPYHVYDVTDLLQAGDNALGATLGDGWYAGYLVWAKNHFLYGDQLSLLAQLEIDHTDGRRETIGSGPEWKTSFGPILTSDIYNGETYDARRELPGWAVPAFDDAAWAPASVFPAPEAALVARRTLPVRKQEELPTLTQTEPTFGVHVFDLGQNMVGWARIKLRAPAGQVVTIRYGEMLQDDGTLYTANLRSAKCTDSYTCKGDGEETFEPHFTFHGFRYVELTGVTEKPVPSDVTGVVLHSEIPQTGTFECSNALVNRLQKNIEWGQKGNFLEVPTDCPQRDERLGWTGDAQVFIRTACFNRDVAAFFTKWGIDMIDAQHEDGALPHVVPDAIRDGGRGCAAWADAAVIIPWTVYLCYGDIRMLERQYDSMVKWIEWRNRGSRNLINASACFGDWLAIDIAENSAGKSPTPRDLIATAYFARTTEIVAQAAALLGRRKDAVRYRTLANRVKAAFNREFVSPSGRVVGDTQTGYLLALGFDLLPKAKQAHAVEQLVRDIEAHGCHLSTGFVGTPLLAPVLSRFGRTDVAYKLLLQQTYPSWIYSILQGATTMWERWNSYTKDRGFGDVGMNSFNHYAYGAIGEWLYNTVAGIELDETKPGYKHLVIRPQPPKSSKDDKGGETLSWVKAELMTRYGKAACSWKRTGSRLAVKVTIPPNTTATVILPGQKPSEIAAGTYAFSARME